MIVYMQTGGIVDLANCGGSGGRHDLLQEKALLNTFGVARLPTGANDYPDAYEITVGRTTLTFPGGEVNKGVGAMWRFEAEGDGVCARVCSQCRDLGDC